jgi:5-methylcytosine-specific restriction endonuclease McrA
MDAALIRVIWRRAKGVCEYCRMSQVFYPTIPFQVDHILARQHGGETKPTNLALACLHCNSRKGPNIAGLDPKTRELTRLFNPRRQKWGRHFRWIGPLLVGRTKTGRATVIVLAMNDPNLVAVRQALIEEGRFPPRG